MTSKEIAGIDADGRLDAGLRELKTALRELRVPARHEDALRNAFRAQHSAAQPVRAAARPRWRRAPALAAAAVLAVGIVAGALVGLDRLGREGSDGGVRGQVQQTESSGLALTGAFRPLMYAPGLSPTGSYSVVRVRIPLSSLAIGHGGELEGTIEADVLLGEDGLASAIRFDAEDSLLVSTVSR